MKTKDLIAELTTRSEIRIIFTIPYETDFTLIGTTDIDHQDLAEKPVCSPEEQDYLLQLASTYLKTSVTADDVVATYSGVRPLYNDAASSATAATRDYVLKLDKTAGAPMLNVFGGKITTYRKLAEQALQQISDDTPQMGQAWTAGVALPGDDFPVGGVDDIIQLLIKKFPFLTAREVAWLMDKEFAQTAEDVIWRRSKLGLRLTNAQIERLQNWMQRRLPASGT